MLEVAEAIVRVYHRFGDYKHRQRNRMKFLIKDLGWEALASEVRRGAGRGSAGRRRAVRCERRGAVVEAGADWTPPPAPSLEQVKRTAASVEVHGPGIMPGSVKLQTFSDSYLDVAAHQRRSSAPGRASCT